jgi:hypothetical protein
MIIFYWLGNWLRNFYCGTSPSIRIPNCLPPYIFTPPLRILYNAMETSRVPIRSSSIHPSKFLIIGSCYHHPSLTFFSQGYVLDTHLIPLAVHPSPSPSWIPEALHHFHGLYEPVHQAVSWSRLHFWRLCVLLTTWLCWAMQGYTDSGFFPVWGYEVWTLGYVDAVQEVFSEAVFPLVFKILVFPPCTFSFDIV